jgi:flagellar basal-body rod protein FlgB
MASRKGATVAIADMPIFSALKSKMSWLQSRQTILAENVANADTPGYTSNEIEGFSLPGATTVRGPRPVAPMLTNPMHIAGTFSEDSSWNVDDTDTFEITPTGNSVVVEEEMMKVAETQLDYQMATGLYSRGLGLLKTALGRRV